MTVKNSIEDNINKLKSYISGYGDVNNNGNKYIKWTDKETDGIYIYDHI